MGAWGYSNVLGGGNRANVVGDTSPWYASGFNSGVCCDFDHENSFLYIGSFAQQNPNLISRVHITATGPTPIILNSADLIFPAVTFQGAQYNYQGVTWWRAFSYVANKAVGIAAYRHSVNQTPLSFFFKATVGSNAVTVYPLSTGAEHWAQICDDGVALICARAGSSGQYSIFRDGVLWKTATDLGLSTVNPFGFTCVEGASDRIMGFVGTSLVGSVYDSALGTFPIADYVPAGNERGVMLAQVGHAIKWSRWKKSHVGTCSAAGSVTILPEFEVKAGKWRAEWADKPMVTTGIMRHPVAIPI
jgi:hypothetical protein